MDTSILSKFYSSPPVESAEAFVSRVIDVHQGLKAANGSTEGNTELKEKDEKARKEKWDELVKIMQELEGMHGWKEVDGLQYYTKDEDPSHKSNVLGECHANAYEEKLISSNRRRVETTSEVRSLGYLDVHTSHHSVAYEIECLVIPMVH